MNSQLETILEKQGYIKLLNLNKQFTYYINRNNEVKLFYEFKVNES